MNTALQSLQSMPGVSRVWINSEDADCVVRGEILMSGIESLRKILIPIGITKTSEPNQEGRVDVAFCGVNHKA